MIILSMPLDHRSCLVFASLIFLPLLTPSTKLQTSYGLGGIVLAWLTSYLSNRTQYVHCSESTPTPLSVLFGVPHGFGPRADPVSAISLYSGLGAAG